MSKVMSKASAIDASDPRGAAPAPSLVAVFEDVEALAYQRFCAVVGRETTFAGKVGALLDEAVRLLRHDPSLAGFLRSVTLDRPRHTEIVSSLRPAWPRRDRFFRDLVDAAIDAGEIDPSDRDILVDSLIAMMTGLIALSPAMPTGQTEAVQGFKRMLRGERLVTTNSGLTREVADGHP